MFVSKKIISVIFASVFFILGISYFSPLILNVEAKNSETYRQLTLFGDVFQRVREAYVEDVTDKDLIKSAINGMLANLDPHSSFMGDEDFQDMQVQTKGAFGGLGIEVTMEDGFVKVVSPIDDTPADKANIQPGDLIIGIDNEGVYGLTLDEAVEKLRGKIGDPVNITIRRGKNDPFEVKIIRDEIKISSVKSEVFDNIGYIRLTTFSQQTTPGLVKAVQGFKKDLGDKLKGVVLDLRNNPGGLLSEAISVSDSFLELGEIVSTRGRNGNDSTHHYSRPGDIINGLPLVVLINSGSASASEIVAGALKDHKRAVLLGTRSFGKGSVQTVIPLPGHGAMRLTTARYYTPSGISIQAKGISPDIEVKVAKIEPIDFGIVREEDIRGALDKKEKENSTEIDDNITDISEISEETSLGSELDVTEKTQDEIDFQLSRALDLIRGASVFSNLKK
ncbi:MAG: S41 family peptidase [Candidatus Puniceispirillales bacterium]